MKAIVCDLCGKVTLLQDDSPAYGNESGVYQFYGSKGGCVKIDLCEECVDKLMVSVRKE